jgi:hypothetical protein
MSEKELQERTLTCSLTVLTEILSVASPAAFSRALRLRRYMSNIVARLSLTNGRKLELAALLSQVGCVAMLPETMDAVCAGEQLSPKEQALYDTHPRIADDLLKNIPRMESVAWMIAHQNQPVTVDGDIRDRDLAESRFGAVLLQAILAFDTLVLSGCSRTEAAFRIARKFRDIDSRIPMALVEVEPEHDKQKEVSTCSIGDISPGMIFEQEVCTDTGLLIIARNQQATPSVILKLKNYYEKGVIPGDIEVSVGRRTTPPSKN